MSKSDSARHPLGSSRRQFVASVGSAFVGMLLPIRRLIARGAGAPAPSHGNFSEDDVRHYGIVANSEAAATANTKALQALVSPAGQFSGKLVFTNSGSDVYYFNDLIAFHDGVHLDLDGSTLKFSKVGTKSDSASGFIHAIRDFTVENGSIVTSYDFKGGYNAGNILTFGGRGMDTALFPNIYDRQLPSPMGNIVVRNLQLSGTTTGGSTRAIFMLGGFDGVTISDVTIDGLGKLTEGIYYEFGWATNEPREIDRQTSHAKGFRVNNLTVKNVVNESFGANGAFDISIDGFTVENVGHGCLIGTGESLYYNPWLPPGDRPRRPIFSVRNMTGEGIRNVGVAVTGASSIAGSYLDHPPAHDNPHRLSADQQTDLLDFFIDHFTLRGPSKNYGITTSAGIAQILNGTITEFARGIVTTQECTRWVVQDVKIFDSAGFGMLIGQGVTIHNPPRQSTGLIRNCVIAGSGTASKSAGVVISTTRGCVIEGSRFGYDQSMDGKAEATQTNAVLVGGDAYGVICRNNFVSHTADDAVAYVLAAGGGGGRDCSLEVPRGIQTITGAWSPRGRAPQSIRSDATINIGGAGVVRVSAAGEADDVQLQSGARAEQCVVVMNDGPAANSISFSSSNVENTGSGHAGALAGMASRMFVWDEPRSSWRPLN